MYADSPVEELESRDALCDQLPLWNRAQTTEKLRNAHFGVARNLQTYRNRLLSQLENDS